MSTSSSSRDVHLSNQSASSVVGSSSKRGAIAGYGGPGIGGKTNKQQGKHVTPSASTSVTSERESGVGSAAASDEVGGARGSGSKQQLNDGGKAVSNDRGGTSGRGVSPAADAMSSKGVATSRGNRKFGSNKMGKELPRNHSTSSGSSNPNPAQSGSGSNYSFGSNSAPRVDTSISSSHRNNTPPPSLTSQSNLSRSAQPVSTSSLSSVSSSKRNDHLPSKDLPPSGRVSQHQPLSTTSSRSKSSNASRSTLTKSHRHHQHCEGGERDSGNEHQRIGKRGSSDSSRESDKEIGEPPTGGGGSWMKKSGSRSASTAAANMTSSSNDRLSSSSPLPSTTGSSGGHVTSRSNQKQSSFNSKLQGENAWNQDVAEEWADEEIDPSVFSECSTDDDKLRNKRKKAAAAAAQSMTSSSSVGVVTRPVATAGIPTPTTTTTVSFTASHSWQEVTKTTRYFEYA